MSEPSGSAGSSTHSEPTGENDSNGHFPPSASRSDEWSSSSSDAIADHHVMMPFEVAGNLDVVASIKCVARLPHCIRAVDADQIMDAVIRGRGPGEFFLCVTVLDRELPPDYQLNFPPPPGSASGDETHRTHSGRVFRIDMAALGMETPHNPSQDAIFTAAPLTFGINGDWPTVGLSMVTTPVGLAIGRQRLIDGSEEIGSPRHGDVAVFESGGLAGYSLEMRDGWPAWVATTATNSDPDIVCIKDLANGLGVLTMPSGRSYLCCAGQRHRLLVVSIDAGAPRDVVAELAMPTAINSVAVDASGTRLVACGDRSALYIVTVEEADNGTSLTLTLEDTIDSIGIGWGQYVACNVEGTHFAVSSDYNYKLHVAGLYVLDLQERLGHPAADDLPVERVAHYSVPGFLDDYYRVRWSPTDPSLVACGYFKDATADTDNDEIESGIMLVNVSLGLGQVVELGMGTLCGFDFSADGTSIVAAVGANLWAIDLKSARQDQVPSLASLAAKVVRQTYAPAGASESEAAGRPILPSRLPVEVMEVLAPARPMHNWEPFPGGAWYGRDGPLGHLVGEDSDDEFLGF